MMQKGVLIILSMIMSVFAVTSGAFCGANLSTATKFGVAVLPLDEFNFALYSGWSPLETPLTLSSFASMPRLQFQVTTGLDTREPVNEDFVVGLGFANKSFAFVNITVSGPALGRATMPPSFVLPAGEWQVVAFFVNISSNTYTFQQPVVVLPANFTVLSPMASSAVPGVVRFSDTAAFPVPTKERPRCVVVGRTVEPFAVEVLDSSLQRLFVAPATSVTSCVASVFTSTGALRIGGAWRVAVPAGSNVTCTFSGLLVEQFGVGAVLTVAVLSNGTADPIGSVAIPLVITRLPTPQCYIGFSFGSPSWLARLPGDGVSRPSLVRGAVLPPVVVGLFSSDHERSSSVGLMATAHVYFESGIFTSTAIAAAPVTCGFAIFDSIKMPAVSSQTSVGSVVRFVFSVSTPLQELSLVSRPIVVAASTSASLAFAVFDTANQYFPREGATAFLDPRAEVPRFRVFAMTVSGSLGVRFGGSATLRYRSPDGPVVSSCAVTNGVCTFSRVVFPFSGSYAFCLRSAAGIPLPVLWTGHVELTTRPGPVTVTFAPWGSLFTRELMPSFAVIATPLPPIRLLVLDRFGAIVRSENQILVRALTLEGVLSANIAAAIGGEIVFPGLTFLSCFGFCTMDFVVDSLNVTLSTGPLSIMSATGDDVTSVQFADSGLSLLRSGDTATVSAGSTLPPVAVDVVTAQHLPLLNFTTPASVSCSAGGSNSSDVSPIINGSAMLTTIRSAGLSAPSLANLSCCLKSAAMAVSRCTTAPLFVSDSVVWRMFVSATRDPLDRSSAVAASASVWCGSSLCLPFPASNVTIEAAALFRRNAATGSSPSFTQTAGIQSGISDLVQLLFSSPRDIPPDKAMSITFTSSVDPSLSCGSALLTVGEMPIDPAAVIDVYIAAIPAALAPDAWVSSFAVFLAIDPSRIYIRRAVQAYLAKENFFGTRLEIAVGQPTTVVPQLLSSAALTEFVTQITPSCQNEAQNIVLAKLHAQRSTRCDSAAFAELAESSLHCEIFSGQDARCGCFLTLIYSLGDVCLEDAHMPTVCAHLGRCNDGKINAVCSQVQVNIPLQIFFVVGGTAVGMLILFALCRVRRAPKLATRVFVHQNTQHVLLAQRGKAEDVVFS
jgi:hypothetical protein